MALLVECFVQARPSGAWLAVLGDGSVSFNAKGRRRQRGCGRCEADEISAEVRGCRVRDESATGGRASAAVMARQWPSGILSTATRLRRPHGRPALAADRLAPSTSGGDPRGMGLSGPLMNLTAVIPAAAVPEPGTVV